MPTHAVRVVVRLVITVALGFTVAVACTKDEGKKQSRGSGDAAPTPTPQSSAEPVENCLRLQDEDASDPTETAAPAEEGAEEQPASGVGTASTTGCPVPDKASPSPGDGSGGGWDPGPGLEACREEGKAWIAVKDGGPGVCGDPLVTWCCSEPEIALQFPNLAAKLAAEFDREPGAKPGIKKDGLKLYACSANGNRTTFHWAKKDGAIKYITVYVEGKAKGGTADASCPMVTSADLGIIETEDETGADGDGEGDGDEVVEVGAGIPATIGVLDDTSKAGLLDFLKAGEYNVASWTKEPKVRSSTEHGKMRVFYNAPLKTSFDNFDTKHYKNSIAVAELYNAAGTVKTGYGLMAKATDGADAESWLFYAISGTAPNFDGAEPSAYGMGVAACVECHKTGGKDHVKSTPP